MPGKYIKPTVVAAGTLFVGRVPFGWVVGSVDGAWGHNALVRRTELKQRSAVAAVAKAQAVLSESDLLWAMFDVDYFPPNTAGRVNAEIVVDIAQTLAGSRSNLSANEPA